MPTITITTAIRAPTHLCFDLARSVELHIQSAEGTDEKAVAGVTGGLVGLGDEVTWEATHFGVRQRLTSRITALERPNRFLDRQVRGPFRRFDHDHIFTTGSEPGTTVMQDVFDYESPLGCLGRFADRLLLERHMTRFLERRAGAIKRAAEAISMGREGPP